MIFKNFSNYVNKNPFWKSFFVLLTGTFLSQIVSVLSTPLISRIFTTSDFGVFAVISSFSTILINFFTFGLSSAVMTEKDNFKTKETFSVIFFLLVFLTFIVLLFLVFFTYYFDIRILVIEPYYFFLFVFFFVVFNGLKSLLLVFFNKSSSNRILFLVSFISPFSTLLISAPLGLLGFGFLGLVMGGILSSFISCIFMLSREFPIIFKLSWQSIKSVFKRNKDFLLFQYPSNFLETLNQQLPIQYFSTVFGSSYLGEFNMNDKLIGTPTRLIGGPLNTIYFRTASKNTNNSIKIDKLSFVLTTLILILGFPFGLLFVFYGPNIFSLLLGPNWIFAGELSRSLSIYYIFALIANALSYLRVSINKQKNNLLISIFHILIVLSIFSLSYFSKLDFNQTVKIYSITSSIFIIFDTTYNFILLKSKYSLKVFLISFLYLAFFTFVIGFK